MSSPELSDFDVDLIELLADRKWDDAAFLLRERAAMGGRISLHHRTVEALACRLTDGGRKKRRGRQCDPLIENFALGEEIEREMQGTSPLEAFLDVVQSRPQIPNPVPHGERLKRLNEIARKKNVSQSKAEKARAAYNRLKVANQQDPPEDDPLS